MFKRVCLATAALTLLSTAAFAADYVEPAPVPSWTAFYIGGGIGAAWSDFDTTSKYCDAITDICYKTHDGPLSNLFRNSDDDTAFRGIVQAGFDWEVASGFVLGVMGDFNFGQDTGVDNKYKYDVLGDEWHDKFSYGVDNMWTLSGRFGFATEQALFYGLVGWTWADTEAKLKYGCFDSDCIATGKSDDTRTA